MGSKGEPDTKTNWSTDSRPQDEATNQPANQCGGRIEYLLRSPVSGKRQRKGKPEPGGYNWATLFLGV
jgi:hypothetical protein